VNFVYCGKVFALEISNVSHTKLVLNNTYCNIFTKTYLFLFSLICILKILEIVEFVAFL